MFHKDVVKFGQRVHVLVAYIQEVVPRISYYLNSFTNVNFFAREQTYVMKLSHTLKYDRPTKGHSKTRK